MVKKSKTGSLAAGARRLTLETRKAASVTRNTRPTSDDWFRLGELAANVDLVIDGEEPHNRLLGLLAGLSPAPAADATISKLAVKMLGRAAPAPGAPAASVGITLDDIAGRICETLPGAHDLGGDRQERLERLTSRLPELPAYAWLTRQENYRKALAVMRGNRVHANYRVDTAEYRLLSVICDGLAAYHAITSVDGLVRYPKSKEIERVAKQAENVRRFFEENTGLFFGAVQNWGALRGADAAAEELARLAKEYTRPANQMTKMRRELSGRFLRGLVTSFGEVSVTLMERLCGLIDYPVSIPNIHAMVRQHGLGKQATPKQDPVAPAPSEQESENDAEIRRSAGLWGGLVSRK
jgi:hypothetical protein